LVHILVSGFNITDVLGLSVAAKMYGGFPTVGISIITLVSFYFFAKLVKVWGIELM
jgi:hypothetical protein